MKLVSCQLSLYTQTRRPCHQVVVLTREVRWQETRGGVHTVHCTIGWSDLPLFAIFRMGHIAADQIYIHICQGWEFTLWFFVPIACFFRTKVQNIERFLHSFGNEQMAPTDLF